MTKTTRGLKWQAPRDLGDAAFPKNSAAEMSQPLKGAS